MGLVVPERDVDPAGLYEKERLAFVSRLRLLPAGLLATRVAATPLWTVRDVLAHVVGITADLNAQRFGEGDGDAWTLMQVAHRRDCSVDDLAAEWDREAPVFEAGLRLFGYGFGAHYLGDLLQHVGDVAAAVGGPESVTTWRSPSLSTLFHAALNIFIGLPTGGGVVANVMGPFVVIGALTIPRRLGRESLFEIAEVTSTAADAML